MWTGARRLGFVGAALVSAATLACGCSDLAPIASTTPAPVPTLLESPTPSVGAVVIAPTPTVIASVTMTVGLDVASSPAFTGDRFTFTIWPLAGWVSSGTVDFGDGNNATASGPCGSPVRLTHAYRTAGDFVAVLTGATACDPSVTADVTDAQVNAHIFPSAVGASTRWPTCTTYQLRLASPWTGAGLGNVATLITIRNVSDRGCTLTGYPTVKLIAADGEFLPTQDHDARDGAYLFPGVAPHLVAVAPGESASFMIGYGDNPSGDDVYKPYDVACPPAVAVRVILPGTHQYGTARAGIGACEGWILVSAIVPGPYGLRFT